MTIPLFSVKKNKNKKNRIYDQNQFFLDSDHLGHLGSIISNFHYYRSSQLEYLSIFWAENFVLVVIHQILSSNVEKIIPSLHFLTNQLTLSRFLVDLVHFNDPELPVGPFSIVKKHFFINTNNVKGFFYCNRARPTIV
jgi:hypothetical protein